MCTIWWIWTCENTHDKIATVKVLVVAKNSRSFSRLFVFVLRAKNFQEEIYPVNKFWSAKSYMLILSTVLYS